MKNIITSDDILGKEAVDPEGSIVGLVVKLHIDKEGKQINGITIDQGFMKPDLYVGINHVKRFGVDAVLLGKITTDRLKGLTVITSTGKNVGIVNEVIKKRTKVKGLIVVPEGSFIHKSKIRISDVKEIGERIVLKKDYKLRDVNEKADAL